MEKEEKNHLDETMRSATCLRRNALDLREVKYSLRECEFYPDLTEEEQKEQENETRERDGFFHQWIEVEELSTQSGNYINVTKALVEDAETGKLHKVDTHLITFVHLSNL